MVVVNGLDNISLTSQVVKHYGKVLRRKGGLQENPSLEEEGPNSKSVKLPANVYTVTTPFSFFSQFYLSIKGCMKASAKSLVTSGMIQCRRRLEILSKHSQDYNFYYISIKVNVYLFIMAGFTYD